MRTTKLGDIKIEALRLMFADYTNDYSVENLDTLLENDNYGKYLRAMNGSINRCFDRFRSSNRQPIKKMIIDKGEMTDDPYLHIDLDDEAFALIDKIIRITYENADNLVYKESIEYELEGRELIIQNDSGEFRIIYYETLPFITDEVDTDVIEIEDELARIVPYFIKSDLLEEDEPEMANRALSLFEQRLNALPRQEKPKRKKVKDVYKGYDYS